MPPRGACDAAASIADRHRRLHEHPIAPDHGRRRAASGNLDLPADVLRLAPFGRRSGGPRDAGRERPPPLRPEAFARRRASGAAGAAGPPDRRSPSVAMTATSAAGMIRNRAALTWILLGMSVATKCPASAGRMVREGGPTYIREMGCSMTSCYVEHSSRPAWSRSRSRARRPDPTIAGRSSAARRPAWPRTIRRCPIAGAPPRTSSGPPTCRASAGARPSSGAITSSSRR